MVREIKFRGKSIESGKWLYGSLMKHQPFLDVRYYIKDSVKGQLIWHHVTTESIGQFTGMTDQNSKEIYEGDIMVWENKTDEPDDDTKGVVKYEDGTYYWSSDRLSELDLDSFIIIGNIYENAELISKK